MTDNTNTDKVYLSFGRHGRYGTDTDIDHMSMLEAYFGGRQLAKSLPLCETIFYSPIARAVQTMKFRGLGLGCRHVISCRELEEDMSTFVIRRFIDNIIQSATKEEKHFHFITHLPVLEKLGLPELDTCGVCICEAENWQEMLAENYTVKIWHRPTDMELDELLNTLRIDSRELANFSPNGIYSALSRLA